MGNTDHRQEQVQAGVCVAERLLDQKQYNLSMIKARQTLELMVKCLSEKAGVVESDLINMIEHLYEGHHISKTTHEHYHKIRMIGNKAVHEGNADAEKAAEACRLLSIEARTFAHAFAGPPRRQVRSRRAPASRRRSAKKRRPDPAGFIVKFSAPVILIVLLIVLIKALSPGAHKAKPGENTSIGTGQEITGQTVPESSQAEPETTAPPAIYRTTSNLNIRSGASTDSKLLGTLPEGTQVDYVRPHDENWAVIRYNGQEVYVNSKYLLTEP